jgi:hypothetical protein
MNGTTQLVQDLNVAYGATPSNGANTPTKASTAQYSYSFAGWSATNGGTALVSLPSVEDDATYYAVFTETLIGTGGGGGGGGGAVSPETEQTISGNVMTTSATVAGTTDTSGSTTAELGSDLAAALNVDAQSAEEEGLEAVVEIKVETGTATKSVELVIPGDAFKDLADDTDAKMRIDAGFAMITFDADAVESISEEAGSDDVRIVIEAVDVSTLSADAQNLIGDRPVYDFSITAGDEPITSFGSGSAAISIPYELQPGEDGNAVVVYYIDEAGNIQSVRGVYDDATGTVDFTVYHLSTYAVGYNMLAFLDVPEDAWYYDAVTFIAARGITNGTGGHAFGPDETLTRAQFLVMLMRAYGIEPAADPADNFADAGDTYYTNYLAKAKELGIAVGVGDNLFAPDSEISRQDMVTLLYRTLRELDELSAAAAGAKLSDFSDADSIPDYAWDAFESFVDSGIIPGSAGKLKPAGLTSRAQMAQILYQLLSA